VPPITLRSLVRRERAGEIARGEWFFCGLADCEVVYFARDGRTLDKSALTVRVGVKEKVAPRPVCYCFGHTVESIREEIERTGRSTAAASITAKVNAGECRCEILNPKGSCCLSDVHRAVEEAFASLGTGIGRDQSTELRRNRMTRVSKQGATVAGAVVAAFAASACCLGPLVLAVLGLGGAASAVALEAYRPYFLLLTAVLLAGAFYMTYRRPAKACGPGESCERPGATRSGRVLMWVAAVVVILAATFPYYSLYLF
jgi:hypothetical protein